MFLQSPEPIALLSPRTETFEASTTTGMGARNRYMFVGTSGKTEPTFKVTIARDLDAS